MIQLDKKKNGILSFEMNKYLKMCDDNDGDKIFSPPINITFFCFIGYKKQIKSKKEIMKKFQTHLIFIYFSNDLNIEYLSLFFLRVCGMNHWLYNF